MKLKPTTAILSVLLIIAVLFIVFRPNAPQLPQFDTVGHIKDSITIVEAQNTIQSAQNTIDSLYKVKQKTITIIKEVPKIIHEYDFLQTSTAMIAVFDSVELLPRVSDTLFCLNLEQAKDAITTDTLLKLTTIALIQSDSIILKKDVQLTAKDTIIAAQSRDIDRYKPFEGLYVKEVKRKKGWRKAAIIEGAIIAFQFVVRRG